MCSPLNNSQEGSLPAGYREMAAEREREAEALEWCEGLIGDANSASLGSENTD